MANRRQTQWTNEVSRRTAEVEDQKLRLSLLERRAVAVDAIREATQDFFTNGGATPAAVGKVYEAMKVAQLVYDDEEEAAIAALLKSLQRWQAHDRAAARWRHQNQAKLEAAVDAMMDEEGKISAELVALDAQLRAASKVRQVKPLVHYTQSRRTWRRLIKRSRESWR